MPTSLGGLIPEWQQKALILRQKHHKRHNVQHLPENPTAKLHCVKSHTGYGTGITSGRSRPPTHRPPDKDINSVRRQNKRYKKSVIPILTAQNRAQNFHNKVTTRRNRTEITAKTAQNSLPQLLHDYAQPSSRQNLRTFRKKHINFGETAVKERKKNRITPPEPLKKRPPHSKKNKIEATAAENIITM